MAKTRQVMSNWAPHMAGASVMARWQPGGGSRMAGARMGQPLGMNAEQRQMMGIAILSALSIAGLHSAICPSYFTQRTFASQPEAKGYAMEGLWISLGVSTLASGALYFVFDKWLPAIVAEATALALFGIGVLAVNSKPAITVPPMEKQAAAQPVQVPQQATTTQV